MKGSLARSGSSPLSRSALAVIAAGVVVAIFIFFAGAGEARAQSADGRVEKGSFGLGIIIGEPLGLSAKLYIGDDVALDAAVGSAVIGGGLQVHADYLVHPWILEQRESFVMPVYLGGGVRVLDRQSGGEGNEFHLGVRAVLGMLFDFTEVPLDVFVEVAGVLDYQLTAPRGFGLDINAGLGVRYYF